MVTTTMKKRKLKKFENVTTTEVDPAKAFVRTILHRLVDLEWRETDMVKASGISHPTWSRVRNYKQSPTIELMVKVSMAVGLEMRLGVDGKG